MHSTLAIHVHVFIHVYMHIVYTCTCIHTCVVSLTRRYFSILRMCVRKVGGEGKEKYGLDTHTRSSLTNVIAHQDLGVTNQIAETHYDVILLKCVLRACLLQSRASNAS